MSELPDSLAWTALVRQCKERANLHMRDLCVDPGHIRADFSKHRKTNDTFRALVEPTEPAGVPSCIERAVLSGDKLSCTEDRHFMRRCATAPADRSSVIPKINRVLAKTQTFAKSVRAVQHSGHTGKKVTDGVNRNRRSRDPGRHYQRPHQ